MKITYRTRGHLMLPLMSLLLPSLSNAELLESDLEDSRTCEALLDTENSELLVQLKEELHENTADHEHNSGDLISELRKLKQVYETRCSNKDKEATEAVQKFQQKLEELHVAACKKDDEIGRLQAEASASTNKILVLEGKLNEMHSLDKANDIQSLKVGQPETHKHKLAFLSTVSISFWKYMSGSYYTLFPFRGISY
uniref:Uncharacterized protein n=1 Tax=Aegilops tauschii subsp. strangulata TaxID=200361 RepID=A0A452ZSE4_AEGTS